MKSPRRAFAQRTICARWGLEQPTPRKPRGKSVRQVLETTPRTTRLPRAMAHHNSWSPESDQEKENKPARTPLRPLQLDAGQTPAKRSPRRLMPSCTAARLRNGLMQLMTAGPPRVSACPVSPGDWSLWSAHVARADDGSLLTGLEVRLSLRFPADDERDCIPNVKVNRPAGFFHPNVDARSGMICARALEQRCNAVMLVGEQLSAIVDLLHRPVFDVAPANEEAAALCYGDQAMLRQRISARVNQVGSPDQPVLMRGLTS